MQTTLPTKKLGRSGPDITRVGLGAWAIGGGDWAFGWGEQDDRASIAALRRAVELGVNWIDTAAVYGLGHSETVIGRFLRELSSDARPLVFSKCGLVWDPEDRRAEIRQTLEPVSVRRECEHSLRRLGVERIDLYQFHWPDEAGTAIEDSWGEMLRLVEEGKVRWAGVSNFDVSLLERCEGLGHVTSLQPPFSLIRRDVAGSLLPWCAEHGVGVIVYSPMQAGLLTETMSAGRVGELAADDWRRRSPNFQMPKLAANLALRDALRPIAARHEVPVAAVAIGWTLAHAAVTGAIVGARSAAQVDGWIAAATLRLTDDDMDEIARAIEQTGAGSGPRR